MTLTPNTARHTGRSHRFAMCAVICPFDARSTSPALVRLRRGLLGNLPNRNKRGNHFERLGQPRRRNGVPSGEGPCKTISLGNFASATPRNAAASDQTGGVTLWNGAPQHLRLTADHSTHKLLRRIALYDFGSGASASEFGAP